ncbi:MAG: NAD(P)/FAD-dependent oxidoreductase [Thermoplasmata archaeon]|nr:MAG: NAD(P)/FAD-dependent oxidoreductase [Thermoplasmata archaeon]
MGDSIDYDVIVVGAGPGGLVAGERAARGGASVLVVDRKKEIGSPVRCAEGLGLPAFKLLDLDTSSDFVSNSVNRFIMVSPKGRKLDVTVPYKEFSLYILDRTGFEKALAQRLKGAKGELMLDTSVTGLTSENGVVKGVDTNRGELSARVIIGADGVESNIGRWSGMTKRLKMNQIFSAAEYDLAGMEGADDHFEIHFGSALAPGGYAWVFPKGEGEVNLGLGVLASTRKRPVELLNKFKERRAARAQPIRFVTGCIPSTLPPALTVKDNIMLVGDAARQTNAVSGGGIANAIITGKIAGEVAGRVVSEGRPVSCLKDYEQLWRAQLEKILNKKFKQRKYLENDKKTERMFSFMKLAARLRPILPKVLLLKWLQPAF